MKRFTVITICLNMEQEIEETIQSVLDQDWDDFEYLIKDGGSKDRTLEIARSFSADFEKRGIPYRIISQPDSGIYDAMNQAVQESQGEWLIFMNAGDRFAAPSILTQVQLSDVLDTADIVYGDQILSLHGMYRYYKAFPLEDMRFYMTIRHQSTFTRKELLIARPYSLEYRICSDYLFYLHMYLEEKRFSYLPFAVSISDSTGISSDKQALNRELLKMFEEMPTRDEEAIQAQKKKLAAVNRRAFWRKYLWKLIPIRFWMMRGDWKRRKAGWKTKEEFFSEQKKDTP